MKQHLYKILLVHKDSLQEWCGVVYASSHAEATAKVENKLGDGGRDQWKIQDIDKIGSDLSEGKVVLF